MKAFTTLTIGTVLTTVLATASQTQAADIVASPRTLQMMQSLAKVGGVTEDKLDRSIRMSPGRAGAHAASLARSGSADEDKLIRTTQLVSPRWRACFELAPVK